MLREFICPDGEKIRIEECLQGCRLRTERECGRCLSRRLFEWTGKPSVTQLINGTREEYLKIMRDYAARPQELIPALFGSCCHAYLERYADEKSLTEERMSDPTGSYTGQFDYYDAETQTLYDTKTYGSYKAAQVLGLEKISVPAVNAITGEIEKTKSGKPKMKTEYVKGMRHMRDVTLQMNAYRMMLEHRGYPVRRMMLEVIVRDGGTWIAQSRGIVENAFLSPVGVISDRWIRIYFEAKKRRLEGHLNANTTPLPCRPIENWGGRKCKTFCAVKEYCDYARRYE